MREIVFRGKRIDNGEWVYGSLVKYKNGTAAIYCEELNEHFPIPVLPETVGQYTDYVSNGIKVFEGDIVEFETNLSIHDDWLSGEKPEIKPFWKDVTRRENSMVGHRYTRKDQAIVQWNSKDGMWDLKVYNNGMYKRKSKLFTYRSEGDYRVIGNIHDHKYLLEDKNESERN